MEHPETYTVNREEWLLINRVLCAAKLQAKFEFTPVGTRLEMIEEAMTLWTRIYDDAKKSMSDNEVVEPRKIQKWLHDHDIWPAHKKKEIYLQKEILALLRNHGGRMEEELVCQLLGITREEIPWGYKIGWARCHQLGGNFHLILSKIEPILPIMPLTKSPIAPWL